MAASEVDGESGRPSKLRKIDFSDDVTILVGTKEKRYAAHKSVLLETSRYFEAALVGSWLESAKRLFRLPEHCPIAFSIYLNWRYTGFIDLWDGAENITMWDTESGEQYQQRGPRYERIVQCYILGDYLRDDRFCNALIDSYFDVHRVTACRPTPSDTNLAFERLPDTSMLRLLIAHHNAFACSPVTFRSKVDKMNPEIWKQIAIVSVEGMDTACARKTPWARGSCFYHVHEDGDGTCSQSKT